MLSFENSLKAILTIAGFTCTPSQISSAKTLAFSLAATIGPGALCNIGGMALKVCVSSLAPASKAELAV